MENQGEEQHVLWEVNSEQQPQVPSRSEDDLEVCVSWDL